MRLLLPGALAFVALTAAPHAASAAGVPDPFPSLREAGDTKSTAINGWTSEHAVLGKYTANKTVGVKAAVNEKTHALTNAIREAKSPLGTATFEAWQALARKQFNETSLGKCTPRDKKAAGADGLLPLSFAFQGSGNLLPFYQGAVQGLYERGVLTTEIARAAHFGGLSGGGLTSVLTALGFTGQEQMAVSADIATAIGSCSGPSCFVWDLATPIVRDAIKDKDPNAAESLSGRLTLWTCQVDALSDTNKNAVTQGTSKWDSIDDLLRNVRASGSIPCYSIAPPYTVFRGGAHIDGAFCTDFAQLCPKTASKCLKLSTTFVGPNLSGTPMPTVENCPVNLVPPVTLPNVGKPYLTPADTALWTPRGGCTGPGNSYYEDVPFVEQGMTAKPDIFPFFYSALPTDQFATACDWLGGARETPTPNFVANVFEVGRLAAVGWADQNGYCA